MREVTKPVLVDYAEYLILTHQSILKGIGECVNYEKSICNRSRFFQLFLMQEYLYADYLPEIEYGHVNLLNKVSKFISNDIQLFIEPIKNKIDITNEERLFIRKYVIPRSEMILDLLERSCLNKTKKDLVSISVKTYHVDGHLSGNLDGALYEALVDKVVKEYKEFQNY